MRKLLEDIIAYGKVGWTFHIPTLVSATGLIYLLNRFGNLSDFYPLISLIGISEAFSVQRFIKYKRLEGKIDKYGFKERIIKPYLASPCGRLMAKMACQKKGFISEYFEFYRNVEGI